MADNTTVASLITKVRQRADQIGSTTFDDATELRLWVRASLRQLQEIITQQSNDWYTVSVPLTLLAGVEAYSVPSDLKRISNVYALYNYGVYRVKLQEFEYDAFGALNFPFLASNWNTGVFEYRLMRNLLYIQPTPTQDMFNALEISYVPEVRHPLLDYTRIDDMLPAGFDEWVVLDVLQKMSVKTRLQNMDDILKSKGMIETRIKTSMKNRSDRAPRMRDQMWAHHRPIGHGNPRGPLVWVGA